MPPSALLRLTRPSSRGSWELGGGRIVIAHQFRELVVGLEAAQKPAEFVVVAVVR